MKHIILTVLKYFFLTLGIIFFLLLLTLGYIWIADPFHIREVLPEDTSVVDVVRTVASPAPIEEDGVDKHPLLSETQEAQLEAAGIDPAALPTTITPEMQTCAIEKLGEERVRELMGGADPTAADLLRAGSCLK